MRATAPSLVTALFTALATLTTFAAAPAHAAERWIDRPMTLHRYVFAGDVGLGVGHLGIDRPDVGFTGPGMNFEAAFGVTEKLELGIRTGVRFGNDGRTVQADYYARPFSIDTYGTGTDTGVNPELRGKYVVYSGSVAEIGLEGRMYLPAEHNTDFGIMLGVPLAFHVTDWLRIDTGLNIPIIFSNSTYSAFSIPGYFWFQATEKLWAGPMVALRFINPPGDGGYDAHLALGAGVGYQVASAVDLKAWFLFPYIDQSNEHYFGAGLGVQFRLNE